MYEKLPNLTIGFHGCSQETYNAVINNHEELKASNNDYDWLGHGIYFWENNLARAKEWAQKKHGDNAAVIGAVIDLGRCLNLTDSASEEILKDGYNILKELYRDINRPLPENRPASKTRDVLQRDLDCAVIQAIQTAYSIEDEPIPYPAFDSVRGVFTEGTPPYPGSAFYSKTHIQICVCNLNCIKGYFEPRQKNKEYRMP